MTKATVQGLMGRKLHSADRVGDRARRGMKSGGTFVLTDTMRRALESPFEGSQRNTRR